MSWLVWLRSRVPALVAVSLLGLVPAPKHGIDSSTSVLESNQTRQISVASGANLLTVGRPAHELWRVVQPRYVSENGEVVTMQEVARFLEEQRSPMAPHALEIVTAGVSYGVDPRLIVAIAGVESSFGRKCRGHNAWGWNNGRTRWKSWPESIHAYTRLISENYPNWRNLRRIAPVYNPNTPEAWGKKVSFLIGSIRTASV